MKKHKSCGLGTRTICDFACAGRAVSKYRRFCVASGLVIIAIDFLGFVLRDYDSFCVSMNICRGGGYFILFVYVFSTRCMDEFCVIWGRVREVFRRVRALLGIVHSFNSFSFFFSNIFLSFCSLILLFAFDTLLTRLKRWVYGKGTI